jgi:hypothetical protein
MTTWRKTAPRSGVAAQAMLEVAHTPDKLRKLASWYRAFAEHAGNPIIWESRLLMAESLEAEAEHVEEELAAARRGRPNGELG